MNEDKPMARGDEREALGKLKERAATHGAAAAGGAMAGAVAGAAGGIAAGPLGSLVGAAAGALAGGAAGAATGPGDDLDTRPFEAFWRVNFTQRPYAAGARYEDFEPAYRFGIRQYAQTDHAQTWAEVQDTLGSAWRRQRGDSPLSWAQAMPAVRDAWERMYDPSRFG